MNEREFKQTLKECQEGLPRAAAVAAGGLAVAAFAGPFVALAGVADYIGWRMANEKARRHLADEDAAKLVKQDEQSDQD